MIFTDNYKILALLKFLILFLFTTSVSIAQNRGLVLDKSSNKPLMGVNICLNNKSVVAITNGEGAFYLRKNSNIKTTDTLNFSYVGYETVRIPFGGLKATNYIVSLVEEAQQLKEVTVVTTKLPLKVMIDYKQLKSLKEGLYAFGSVLVGDKIYVIGGDATSIEDPALKALSTCDDCDDENKNENGNTFAKQLKPTLSWEEFNGNMQVYNLKTDIWVKSHLKFNKRTCQNMHYFKGKLYILGGKSFLGNGETEYLNDKIEVYDLKHDSILVAKTNPHRAVNFASCVYGENLIVMGGSTQQKATGEKVYSSKAHVLNLKTGYWYELEDMPEAMETKGVLINNSLYLIGGFHGKPLKKIQVYNVVTGEWKDEGPLFYEVERPALTTNGNMIYMYESGRIQTYNIETKELNAYLIDLDLKFSELFYANHTLYLVGGMEHTEYSTSPSSNLYSIDLDEFKKTEPYNPKF